MKIEMYEMGSKDMLVFGAKERESRRAASSKEVGNRSRPKGQDESTSRYISP